MDIVSGGMGMIKLRSIIPHSSTDRRLLRTPNHVDRATGIHMTGTLHLIGKLIYLNKVREKLGILPLMD
jgi:hypothetical protein